MDHRTSVNLFTDIFWEGHPSVEQQWRWSYWEQTFYLPTGKQNTIHTISLWSDCWCFSIPTEKIKLVTMGCVCCCCYCCFVVIVVVFSSAGNKTCRTFFPTKKSPKDSPFSWEYVRRDILINWLHISSWCVYI